jgi:ATP-binding cassette subfamily B protein
MSTNRPAPQPQAQRPMFGANRGPFAGAFGPPPQKAKTFRASARRLLGRLAPQRLLIYAVLVTAIGSVALQTSGPRILGHATDLIYAGFQSAKYSPDKTKDDVVKDLRQAGENQRADMISGMDVVPGKGIDLGAVAATLTLLLGLYVGAALLTWMQSYLLNFAVQRTVKRLREDVEAKLGRLPLSYFDNQPRGEILSRVTNDIDNVGQSLQQSLGQVLGGLLSVIGIVIMLVVTSRLLSLISLVTIPVSVFVTAKIGKRAQKRFGAQWAHLGALNGQIEEVFTGHSLVKVLGRRKQVEARFEAKNGELYEASFRAQFISSLVMPAITFVGNLNYVAIAVVGGVRVAKSGMQLGGVQAFMLYSRQFSQQLSQLASMANVLQSGVASAERVFELLDAPDQPADRVTEQLGEVRGEVRFDDVSFRYKPEQPLIEQLSLVAKPGQTVAIVGPTGAGKTTLVNLLMRFYELDAGKIQLDGVDIAGLARDDLRSRIGMVLQDTWLFGGTIRENIAYGKPSATEAEIVAAAQATHVDRFVRQLPLGYATVIDEEASNLSAGEKQLITIARAFLADPALLILDEATSSVDTRTEVLVQNAMAALRKHRTSFVIAHRLSTIRDADLILVMEHGRIVEQGSHAELLARTGAYHALYHAQFAAPAA